MSQLYSLTVQNLLAPVANIASLTGGTATFSSISSTGTSGSITAGNANLASLSAQQGNIQALTGQSEAFATSNIGSLTAQQANIQSLVGQTASFVTITSTGNTGSLTAATGNLTTLNAQQANIQSLVGQTASFVTITSTGNTGSLTAATGNLTTLNAQQANIQSLVGQTASFVTITSTGNTGSLTAATGNLTTLNAQQANIQSLVGQTASFVTITSTGNTGSLTAATGNLTTLNAQQANIQSLVGQTASFVTITSTGNTGSLTAATGNLTTLNAQQANIQNLVGQTGTFSGTLISGASTRATYPINVAATVGAYTQVFYINDPQLASTYVLNVVLAQSRSANAIQKSYVLPCCYTYPTNGWARCIPDTNSGPANSNDFALDININTSTGQTTVRVVRTSVGGGIQTGLTAFVNVKSDIGYPITVSSDGTTGTGATNSGIYIGTPMGRAGPNVGILTATPAYPLDVAGSSRFTGNVNVISPALNVTGVAPLALGFDQTKELNAGKISYTGFSGSCLDIIGAGTVAGSRRVFLYDNVGIGTNAALANAAYQLDVQGTGRIPNFLTSAVTMANVSINSTGPIVNVAGVASGCGDLISTSYGTTANRYGLGMYANPGVSPATRVFASSVYAPAFVGLSLASSDSALGGTTTFVDVLTASNTAVTVNRPAVLNSTLSVTGQTALGSILSFPNLVQNQVICLWTQSPISPTSTDYYGFGINGGTLRYNAPVGATHSMYCGNTLTASLSTSGLVMGSGVPIALGAPMQLGGQTVFVNAAGDSNHRLVYDASVDGPSLYGYGGGKLASSNGNVIALRWTNQGISTPAATVGTLGVTGQTTIATLLANTSTLGNVQGPLTVSGDIVLTGNIRQTLFGNSAGGGLMNYTFGNLAAANASVSGLLTALNQTTYSGQPTNAPLGNASPYQQAFAYNYNGAATGYAHCIRTRHNGGGSAQNAIDFYTWQQSDGQFGVANNVALSVTSAGVGVNQAYPQYQLDVNGSVRLQTQTLLQQWTGSGQSGFFVGNQLATNQCAFLTYNSPNVPGVSGGVGLGVFGVQQGLTIGPTGNVGMNQTAPQYNLHVSPTVTDTPAINHDATNSVMVYEDCRGATVSNGTLGGATTYSQSGMYILLTPNSANQQGWINYPINPGTAFDVTFEHYVANGNGADGTCFYCYSNTGSTYTDIYQTSNTCNGYVVAFSEWANTNQPLKTVALYYNGTYLAGQTSSTFTIPIITVWNQVRLNFVRNVWKVWYNNTLVINYQDVSRNLVGASTGNMGFSSQTGSNYDTHAIRSIQISKHTQGPWRPSLQGNTLGVSYPGPVAVVGNVVNPAYSLDVTGIAHVNISNTITTLGTARPTGMRVENMSTTGAAGPSIDFACQFTNVANPNKVCAQLYGEPDNSTGGRLILGTANTAGNLNQTVWINAAQQVGINNQNPGYTLDVGGSARITGSVIATYPILFVYKGLTNGPANSSSGGYMPTSKTTFTFQPAASRNTTDTLFASDQTNSATNVTNAVMNLPFTGIWSMSFSARFYQTASENSTWFGPWVCPEYGETSANGNNTRLSVASTTAFNATSTTTAFFTAGDTVGLGAYSSGASNYIQGSATLGTFLVVTLIQRTA